MDLHDRLSTIAGPAGATSAEQADADVARGRRALRRRRAFRSAGASAFAVAALAAAVTYGARGDSAPPAPTTNAAPATADTKAGPAGAATRLVAYQGEQPKGFTIDKVPAGWEIQGVNQAVLTIAPTNAKDKNPDSFVDKIAIMLQSKDDTSTPTGTAVKVGDKPGVINVGLGTDHGKNLWVKEPNGIWLLVQIWDAGGWSDAAMVEFGDGIHVLPGAVQGRG
jgi:hypothetical protein